MYAIRSYYAAFPGDPAWADFITGEGLSDDEVPQPSALAEFFGDHMLVNGVDFLCYLTPAEHLTLPCVDDVRQSYNFV